MATQKPPSWEEKFEERMRTFEKNMEILGKKLEEKGELVGKELEQKARALKDKASHGTHSKHQLFWGLALVIVGLVWLGNNLGWFQYSIPLIPVAMIVAGVFLILKHKEISDNTKEQSKKKESK
jgi:Flp pilus assembly protein TadB